MIYNAFVRIFIVLSKFILPNKLMCTDLLLVVIINDGQLPSNEDLNLVRFVCLTVCLVKLNFDKTRLKL